MIRLTVPDLLEEDLESALRVLRSGFLVQGQQVKSFEEAVAEYLGVPHAVAVSSGTAALHISLLALGVKPGDEVILPDFTFPATANVVSLTGAKPVFVDIDLASYNIDPSKIAAALTPKTRAILPVHLFGQSADMEPILALAKKHRLTVIEDAACALGAVYGRRKCGTMGELGCFSFHPRKIITTGEGGMVVTEDAELAQRLRQLRSHGMAIKQNHLECEYPGLNYRMTDFQAALGLGQVKRVEALIEKRQAAATAYQERLSRIKCLTLPKVQAGCKPVWQSFVVLARDGLMRDKALSKLKEAGIEATIGTYAIGLQPAYSASSSDCPSSRKAYACSMALPFYPGIASADIERVAEVLEGACI